jgi:hypothetical protein
MLVRFLAYPSIQTVKKMALLGVYENETNRNLSSLRAIHFNLWIVEKCFPEILKDALLFRGVSFYKYFADVGLRLEVKEGTVPEVNLHLPAVKLLKDSFFDLEEKVLDENTNDLIFGRKVESKNNTISFLRAHEKILDTVHGIERIDETDRPGCFRIALKSAITSTEKPATAYIRFRYQIPQDNDIISPIGWGFAKKGFTFDLRLNDYREAVEYRGHNKVLEMMNGDEANIFVIHPASYSIVSQSPEPHYVRLLEPKVWENYLDSCRPFKISQKFIITQWGARNFDHGKPARVFAKIHKEFGMSVAIVYFVGILTVPIANGLFHLISTYIGG